MKLFKVFLKNKGRGAESHFSAFLLHASPEKQERVFTDAAKLANKDQQETLRRAKLELNRVN